MIEGVRHLIIELVKPLLRLGLLHLEHAHSGGDGVEVLLEELELSERQPLVLLERRALALRSRSRAAHEPAEEEAQRKLRLKVDYISQPASVSSQPKEYPKFMQSGGR